MPRVSRFTPLARIPAVVLDTETTGLEVRSCRLVQISAVRFAAGEILADQTFDQLVNPRMPIPPHATTIHGIDDAMVASAPTFSEVKPALDAFIGESVIIGQSIGFDLAVLLRETSDAGLRWQQPQFLDTKLLAAALDPTSRELDLDALAASLGVRVSNRHSALADALVTAEVFARLLPRLEAAGILTLGDAQARSNAQTRIRARHADQGWYDVTSLRPADAFESGRDASTLARLDVFAYRYRVAHVMNRDPVMIAPSARLHEAIQAMAGARASAALAGDAAARRVDGILTQGDIMRALASVGAPALEYRVEGVMSSPVLTMPEDAFVYRALARLQRHDVAQLVIEDSSRRIVGVLSLREVLREEAGEAVVLGDRLSTALTPRDLASAWAELPALARRLLADEVSAPEITAVLGAELRELLARASMLAEKRMETEGAGRPPVPYALLALGRLGRGEVLLGAELDHALVYASGTPGGIEERWFAAYSDHLAEVLSGAGSKASAAAATDPRWRRSLDDWRLELQRWGGEPAAAVVHANRFFDFRLAYGDQDVADDLRAIAFDQARRTTRLPRALVPKATAVGRSTAPIDLADAGLAPIEAAARAIAVATGIASLSTPERLAEACSRSGLSRHTADELTELHDQLLGILLAQQSREMAAKQAPSVQVDVGALDNDLRTTVEAALGRAARVNDVVRVALALV